MKTAGRKAEKAHGCEATSLADLLSLLLAALRDACLGEAHEPLEPFWSLFDGFNMHFNGWFLHVLALKQHQKQQLEDAPSGVLRPTAGGRGWFTT